MGVTMQDPVVEQDILPLHFRQISRFRVFLGAALFQDVVSIFVKKKVNLVQTAYLAAVV